MPVLQVLALVAVSAAVVWLVWSACYRGTYRRDRAAAERTYRS
jgi:hypothetical protein